MNITARRGGPKSGSDPGRTRAAVFLAAADLFSRHGFDGVTVDAIGRAAGVNKAMVYYHFADKQTLYRDVVCTVLDEAGARVAEIVGDRTAAADKLGAFIRAFVDLTESHPYLPPLMLREISEGALHFDAEVLARMRTVFLAFARILGEGHEAGDFRQVNPVLAYMSVLGPVLLNAARERAAAQPGREQLPMFIKVPHDELATHMHRVALQMLQKEKR